MNPKVLGALLALTLASAPTFAQGRIPNDAINLSQVHVYNSPDDVASWPVTTAITRIDMRPRGVQPDGLALTFSAQQTWPNYTIPGWSGPLQYTVWAVWYAAGQWNASGIIQMWKGRASTGAPILTDFAANWVYDARWGPGWGHQPVVGEQMGFFVTAGNARGDHNVTSVRERSNVVMVSLPANDSGSFTFPATSPVRTLMDVDADGKAEIAVFRPSSGYWLGLLSSTNFTSYGMLQWGTPGDVPVPGDYDGDSRTDVAVYRPSAGLWLISRSSTRFTSSWTIGWGLSTDIPVPGDYDGDGFTDPAVFRPSTGQWFILRSGTGFNTAAPWVFQWGVGGDIPVPNDYDADGKADLAVFRSSNGTWFIAKSSTNFGTNMIVTWGANGDTPVSGDYDGDGKADFAVYRPSSNAWYVSKSSTGYGSWGIYTWGVAGDVPVPSDFDGDGRMDIAVYRPSTGVWYVLKSTTNFASWIIAQWGSAGDVPLKQ
jgi:VCBS repeat protein